MSPFLFSLLVFLLILWLAHKRNDSSIDLPEVPPEPTNRVPRTSEEFRNLLPVDGRTFTLTEGIWPFDLPVATWRAELTSDPSEDESGFFIDYEIRFTDEEGTELELTLSTCHKALVLKHKEYCWKHIRAWLADPSRKPETYWGDDL